MISIILDNLAAGEEVSSILRSYPTLIPLDAGTVRQIGETLEPWAFDSVYGSHWDKVIPSGAKSVLTRSVQRYVAAVSGPPPD